MPPPGDEVGRKNNIIIIIILRREHERLGVKKTRPESSGVRERVHPDVRLTDAARANGFSNFPFRFSRLRSAAGYAVCCYEKKFSNERGTYCFYNIVFFFCFTVDNFSGNAQIIKVSTSTDSWVCADSGGAWNEVFLSIFCIFFQFYSNNQKKKTLQREISNF